MLLGVVVFPAGAELGRGVIWGLYLSWIVTVQSEGFFGSIVL